MADNWPDDRTMASAPISPQPADLRGRRRDAMAVLACSETAAIARELKAIGPLPPHQDMRVAESGMLMVRGRIG